MPVDFSEVRVVYYLKAVDFHESWAKAYENVVFNQTKCMLIWYDNIWAVKEQPHLDLSP